MSLNSRRESNNKKWGFEDRAQARGVRALELDRLHAPLLEQPVRVPLRLFCRNLAMGRKSLPIAPVSHQGDEVKCWGIPPPPFPLPHPPNPQFLIPNSMAMERAQFTSLQSSTGRVKRRREKTSLVGYSVETCWSVLPVTRCKSGVGEWELGTRNQGKEGGGIP